jgi:hypothetical protein
MKASAVYRKAAETTDKNRQWWSCIEICLAQGFAYRYDDTLVKKYQAMFEPKGKEKYGWWESSDDFSFDCRVLALLFMAEIARDEE